MAYVQVDILLKTAIEGALQDLRANHYLLDDIFNGLPNDQLSAPQYGAKEVQEAKKWFLATDVPVYMQNRVDTPTFPSICIADGGSREMTERAGVSDDIEPIIEYTSPKGTKPAWIYPPFVPQTYDASTGTFTFPVGTTTEAMVPGVFVVSAAGKAYVVKKVVSATQFQIAAGTIDNFTNAYILPPYAVWNLAREKTFLEHRYSIFCAAQSNPVYALWIHAVMVYCLGRYKEAYIEARGAALSTFSSGPLTLDARFEGEKVYFVEITFTCQVECSWIKYVAPKLYEVKGGIQIANGPKTPSQYLNQVKSQGWDMAGDPPPTD